MPIIPLLKPTEAAAMLRVQVQTLNVWRCQRRYPELKWIKVGSRIRYRLADIEEFLKSRASK